MDGASKGAASNSAGHGAVGSGSLVSARQLLGQWSPDNQHHAQSQKHGLRQCCTLHLAVLLSTRFQCHCIHAHLSFPGDYMLRAGMNERLFPFMHSFELLRAFL